MGKLETTIIHAIRGCQLGTIGAEIRYPNRDDLLLIALDKGSKVAASFTQNTFCAAPVVVAKKHLETSYLVKNKEIRYLLINSGNANAATGKRGEFDAINCCTMVAKYFNVDVSQVLPFSTGVIGEYLPIDKFENNIPQIVLKADNWLQAAKAIMTTDTKPKTCSMRLRTPDGVITLTGIAKGSGMINPNMHAPQATMLAYIAIDAELNQNCLDTINQRAIEQSFNSITVDGDTSTNDACVLIATGQGVFIESIESGIGILLQKAIIELYQQLAKDLVRDAEGATKFITITVSGASDTVEAKTVAKSVAHSPLVKTALFASDPNWGRIIAAIGNADIGDLETIKVDVDIKSKDFVVNIVHKGERAKDYREEQGQAIFNQKDIEIIIRLNRGEAMATIWTSDLSQQYIEINASYRS